MLLALVLAAALMCGRTTVEGERVTELAVAPPMPEETAAQEAPPIASNNLHVWLQALTRTRYTHSVPPAPHAATWPADDRWDLDGLAEYATADAIQELVRKQIWYRKAEPVLSIAEDEGLLDGASATTPEEALLRIVSAWLEMETDRRQLWDEYVRRHIPKEHKWHTVTGAKRAAAVAAEAPPLRDTSHLVDVASGVLADWPQHPVADNARLALLQADLPMYTDDPLPASIPVSIAEIRDPVFREQAALMVTALSQWHDVSPELLDAVHDTPTSAPKNRIRLDTWLMNRASAAEDWPRVKRSADRLEAELAEVCASEHPVDVYRCETTTYEQRDVRARLIALGLDQPKTWKDALAAEVWRCHLDDPHEGTSRAELTWDGTAWTAGPWDHPTATTACVDSARPAVVPEVPMVVALTIERG